MELTLSGRRALVTGANGSLGRHFALTLARAGADVAIAARRIEALDDLAASIVALGRRVFPVALDVTKAASVDDAFDRATARLGPITVVVNNAGVAVTKPLLEHTEDDWLDVIDVNLNGAWRVAQSAARTMVANAHGGSIVNVASILGLRVASQVPSYAASKAALIQLTKAMALELARHRIRVNALAPGYVETAMNREFFASDAGQAMIKRIPQRRIGTPEELDAPLLLLASDAGSYMTGSVVTVDGGHVVNSLEVQSHSTRHVAALQHFRSLATATASLHPFGGCARPAATRMIGSSRNSRVRGVMREPTVARDLYRRIDALPLCAGKRNALIDELRHAEQLAADIMRAERFVHELARRACYALIRAAGASRRRGPRSGPEDPRVRSRGEGMDHPASTSSRCGRVPATSE